MLIREVTYGDLKDEIADLEDVIEDNRRLTREIDIVLNGDDAAEQASLCDILAQLIVVAKTIGRTEANTNAILQSLHVKKSSDHG